MKVCHVIDSMANNMGGATFFVAELTEGLVQHGIDTDLYTINYRYLGKQYIPIGVNICDFPGAHYGKKLGGFQPKLQYALVKNTSRGVDLIHDHGLWLFANLYARQAAVKWRIPLVISPHGTLEPWSLKRNRHLKSIVMSLWEKRNLTSAALFHASSEDEARSIRRLGLKQPIAVIPNGIQLPIMEMIPKRGVLEERYPELRNKKWLLFMSRIHPQKGLNELLEVWQKLSVEFSKWHMIIAGPDMDGYGSQLKEYVEKKSLGSCVTFAGMMEGELKECALGQSELFVLPTHSENFGRVIAESLAHCVPVITTKGAPWQDLISYECGWWIEDDPEALQTALLEAMRMPSDKRKSMGLRGRALVGAKYGLDTCVQQMVSAYEWLTNRGEMPNCITTL